MEIRIKKQGLFGTQKLHEGAPLREVMITSTNTTKEKRVQLCFRSDSCSGIITLSESELKKITEVQQ